jgi:hypothetical protein
MRRKISEKLKKWSTLKDRKCLIVQGGKAGWKNIFD